MNNENKLSLKVFSFFPPMYETVMIEVITFKHFVAQEDEPLVGLLNAAQ